MSGDAAFHAWLRTQFTTLDEAKRAAREEGGGCDSPDHCCGCLALGVAAIEALKGAGA